MPLPGSLTLKESDRASRGWMLRVSTLGRSRQAGPARAWTSASSMGGMRNCTFTSVKRLANRLPCRSRKGTPLQRQFWISARIATKVSVLEPAGAPSSR